MKRCVSGAICRSNRDKRRYLESKLDVRAFPLFGRKWGEHKPFLFLTVRVTERDVVTTPGLDARPLAKELMDRDGAQLFGCGW